MESCAVSQPNTGDSVHRAAAPVDTNEDPVSEASVVEPLKQRSTQADQLQQSPLLVRVSSIDDEDQEVDYGIASKTLEVVAVPRRVWIRPHEPPLAPVSAGSPIIQEFTRTWRVLRLKSANTSDSVAKKKELSQDQTLLKNYEPRFTVGEPTFPSDSSIPAYLQPRVAAEDAAAFVVAPRIRFTVGMFETLYCRLVLYDIQLGCRASEEFAFSVRASGSSYRLPRTVFYTLPAHASQHLYLVLKVAKVLMGDGDLGTAPYCVPEKYASESEQQRLVERTADSTRRLGRYQQPLAWGAVPLSEGTSKPMPLYRQRWTLGDDQRLPLIFEAARGTMKERQVPSVCEFDVERLEDQRWDDAKYHHKSLKTLGRDSSLHTTPVLEISDPFTPAKQNLNATPDAIVECREVQPFCHSTSVSTYGLYGGGPVATCYVHTLYVYPLHLEKFGFRNVAMRVQLLAREAEYMNGMENDASIAALYGSDNSLCAAVFTEVNYHQKSPPFDKEIKIALPEQITPSHHLLFTFYHVHCKKLQPHQPQQELVGCAWLPLVAKDSGALVEDNDYYMSVLPASAAARNSTSGGIVSLPAGYTDHPPATDCAKVSATWFTCRTRLLSSVRSQDPHIAAVLEPFQSAPIVKPAAESDEQVVGRLQALTKAPSDTLRHFMNPLLRCVLAYLRFGASPAVRQAAFKAILVILDRIAWVNPRGAKPQDPKYLLLHWVALAFDDRVVESCATHVTGQTSNNERRPQSTVQAIASEWMRAMKEEETRKLSLSYAGVLLQLVLKSLTTATKSDLPQRVCRDDELLMEDLLVALVEQSTNASLGLLVQKEVNQGVASFCRSLFLMATSALPFRVISHFLRWTQRLEGDVNVTVHILFPFINSLIEFEFFAVVNGFHSDTKSQGQKKSIIHRRGAWLARLIFERLLRVVDEQVEDRVRSEALRLLRRTFAAQVYNPRHQTLEQQELIALMYLPMIPSVARFTTDGKLLAAGAEPIPEEVNDRQAVFRRELLICVAHLLSSVTLPYLSWYFRQSCAVGDTLTLPSSFNPNGNTASGFSSLSPTAALLHYRKLVEETKSRVPDGRRQSVIQRNVDKAFVTGIRAALAAFDEVRVHACLSLVRQIIDAFLVADDLGSSTSTTHVLSPDLIPRDATRISLLELETHLKQRRSRHRGVSVGQPEPFTYQRTSATASAAAGSKSPTTKHVSTSGSFTAHNSTANAAAVPRLSTQKSLPRTWGKNYAQQLQQQQQQRVSLSTDSRSTTTTTTASLLLNGSRKSNDDLDTDISDEIDMYTQNLRRIIAATVLKALRTAVDQFDWVLRVIDGPLDYRTARSHRKLTVSVDQAVTLLGALVDLFFLLLQRASAIDCLCSKPDGEMDEQQEEEPSTSTADDEDAGCFLAELFNHLHDFLLRFQNALFATRVAGLPLVHDQRRVQLLVTLSATAKLARVRQLAATLLIRLARVCYTQTGSFLLLQRPLLQVVCSNCFSTSALQIPTASLRDAIDLWRQQDGLECGQVDDGVDHIFALQWRDLLTRLSSQLPVFEAWHEAMTIDGEDAQAVDYETLEDGLYSIAQSVSSHWLLDVRRCWIDALMQLHARRKLFAEATSCTMEAIAYKEQVSNTSDTSWLVTELRSAHALALQAQWLDQALTIGERLLVTLRHSRRLTEYQETLRLLDTTVQQVGECGLMPAYYRVAMGGDLVKPVEYIYCRSKFTSLGEFVGELKAAVRANWPLCERVDVVPEAKPLPPLDRHPHVVYLRVTSVDAVDATTFQYATPFTRTGSGAYGKSSEQMKRVAVLRVARPFPCPTRRQVVHSRHEFVRCPVDNAMDDIRKRCSLLQEEIDKEASGRTDLKTLTLVLKGSVDTHVHGGVPEVIDAFLVDGVELLDESGQSMEPDKSMDKREELADLLVEFLQLCWAALLISRLAFKRAATTDTNTTASAPTNPSHNKMGTNTTSTSGGTSVASMSSSCSSSSSSSSSSIARVLGALLLPPVDEDASLSPLQVEFERGFGVLLDLMGTRVTFAYPRDGDLVELCVHVQSRRKERTVSIKASVPPPPSPPPPSAAPPPPPLPPLPAPPSAVSAPLLVPPPPLPSVSTSSSPP